MKEIILTIDGVRHKLVKDAFKKGENPCDHCSLKQHCADVQDSLEEDLFPCDYVGGVRGNHFEVDYAPDAATLRHIIEFLNGRIRRAVRLRKQLKDDDDCNWFFDFIRGKEDAFTYAAAMLQKMLTKGTYYIDKL